jgi:hypothetical protein
MSKLKLRDAATQAIMFNDVTEVEPWMQRLATSQNRNIAVREPVCQIIEISRQHSLKHSHFQRLCPRMVDFDPDC